METQTKTKKVPIPANVFRDLERRAKVEGYTTDEYAEKTAPIGDRKKHRSLSSPLPILREKDLDSRSRPANNHGSFPTTCPRECS